MKDVTVRWVQTIGTTALFGTLLATSTGCGAIAAAANPKVAWAFTDPAPMSVVVRRADVAEKTAQQVDRVMTDTPANDDSAWLAAGGPKKDDATKTLADLRQHQLYAAGAKAAPAATPAASAAAAPPAAPAEPVAKSAEPAVKSGKGKGAKKKPGAIAKNDSKTNKKGSKNSKNAPLPGADKPALAADPDPTPATTPAAVATVNVATPVASKYPSLLAAINPDLGTAYADIMEQRKALGDIKAQIAAEETALDEKGVPPRSAVPVRAQFV